MENSELDTLPVLSTHQGGCHCGAVRFEVEHEVARGATRCNCSICTKVSQTSSILKPAAFRLLAGEHALATYEWATRTAQRYFCKHCGVHCFGRGHLPQLGGDFVSVNWNCLDDVDPSEVSVVHWDGRHDNWQSGPRSQPWPIFA
jgi:hypothetical protein